jgi:rare lipoprotein A (peptidoglycan hydrolase)
MGSTAWPVEFRREAMWGVGHGRRRIGVLTLVLGALLGIGCAGREPRWTEVGTPLVGLASWYGPERHGQQTASGEVFDMYAYVAAHPNLPFGTYVRVTNLENGRTVVVRIVDRGPHRPDRVIDLSYGAAQALGMVDKGIVPVRVEVVRPVGERQ